jgi:endoglucanase
MKPVKQIFLTTLLVFLATVSFAATPDNSVTHGVTSQWWDIPYPSRFDASQLLQEQQTITIDGKRFITGNGETFVFRGVNIADPAKLVEQGQWNKRLFEEVAAWGANTIRLPIQPVAWREKGKDWYFQRIDEAVSWANALGLYLIIDWHSIGNLLTNMYQHPMYITTVTETTNFWRDIAYRYKDVPTLAVYELFNEPTDNFIGAGSGSLGKLSWDDWREAMETMIDVVQVYDPGVISLVGGFNWAYDLTPVAEKPIRRESVAYAAHAYPQKASPEENTKQAFFEQWESQWGFVADTYPIIATEIGWVREDGFNSHIPVINNDGGYGPNLVNFMERKGISWTVWNFDTGWAPVMISDWNFTPTEQGRFFKEVMLRARNGTLEESVLPSPRVAEHAWMSIAEWQSMHAEDVAIAEKGGIDLLFLGDSITEHWPENFLDETFSGYKTANFGIGGDMTQNLLWRLRNGSTGQLDPQIVVIMIGVNNFYFAGNGPEEIFRGVQADLEQVKTSFPNAHIVLLGILPYGEKADTAERIEVIETNTLLARLGQDPRVEFHDIGKAFLQPDGSISKEIMGDHLHPTEKGYSVFARELKPIVSSIKD